ncbi:MAG: putative toxin-antitoxin system toxin component, PIN family [Pseudomonadota bacterium]|nr:putative toxin-antitoxin system toxin component, PIN family [Pseudomonadota bacterium]
MPERVVLDTNVLISYAIRRQGGVGQAVAQILQNYTAIYTVATLKEFVEKLSHPKFARYITREERRELIAAFLREAAKVKAIEQIRACRDPRDDKFLEAAVAGAAGAIITGDQDLLVLHPFRGIPIMTAKAFVAEKSG